MKPAQFLIEPPPAVTDRRNEDFTGEQMTAAVV